MPPSAAETESLFQRLAGLAEAGEAPMGGDPSRSLLARLALVDRLPVFEFYARILADGGRRRILARLGHEASDVLDEFLSFALEHERAAGLPGMQAFLAVLQSDSPEIKREMDKGRDEVRIMTVHASKGLEAPIVFLVDSGGDAVHASHIPALRALPLDRRLGDAPPAMLWVPGKTLREHPHRRHQGAVQGGRRGGVPAPALCRHDPRRGLSRRLRLPELAETI